ncbi:MAG: tyrosine-protein phosphatase [Candidatus Obscuribacterales bacterium]|nr:tyrosine-protein phosphatase [Candidatus Obscuribacterales bacterium]
MQATSASSSLRFKSFALAIVLSSLSAPQVVQAADATVVAAKSASSIGTTAAEAVPAIHVMNFERVSPTLMRGGAPSFQALKELKAAGVKTIVNLRGVGGASKKEERAAKEIGLDYYNIPMGYSDPNLAKVSSVLDIMRDPAKQPVYLHCMQGADRTGMMVGIHRILADGWQFDKAYSEMRSHHFKPFLIPMRRTVQAFANGRYTYVERQGVSIAGVSAKPNAKIAAEKPL